MLNLRVSYIKINSPSGALFEESMGLLPIRCSLHCIFACFHLPKRLQTEIVSRLLWTQVYCRARDLTRFPLRDGGCKLFAYSLRIKSFFSCSVGKQRLELHVVHGFVNAHGITGFR